MRTPGFGLSRLSSTSGVLPIAWMMSPYLPPHGRLSSRGSSTSESVVPLHGARIALLLGDHRVVVRVGRSAAAQEPERLGGRVPELLAHARWDHHAGACLHVALPLAEAHPPASVGEEVDLLALAVEVLGRLAARVDRRLGKALVDRVSPGRPGHLADLGAVERPERLDLVDLRYAHGGQAIRALPNEARRRYLWRHR